MRFLELLRQSLGMGPKQAARPSATAPESFVPTLSTTFLVSDVPSGTSPLPELAYGAAVECQLQPPPSSLSPEERRQVFGSSAAGGPPAVENPSPVEACCRYRGRLLAGVYAHPFVSAVHAAFAHHRSLVLSPDMLWLLVAQGFANHVNLHAETLRPRFVRHAGKLVLSVRRDDFVKGSPENPWEEVFDAFSATVREHIGAETHDLLLPAFSTTGEVERAAVQVVLLESMRSYFSYELRTLCGIPSITLEGTPADWDRLVMRVGALAGFGLEWWVKVLLPILEEFSEAARGQIRGDFWRSLYKEHDGSGGPYLTGWVTAFYPYLSDEESGRATVRNSWLTAPTWGKWEEASAAAVRFGGGPTLDQIPNGLSRAPLRWEYLHRSHLMEFLAGFTGIRQSRETLALRPEIGWAVRDAATAG